MTKQQPNKFPNSFTDKKITREELVSNYIKRHGRAGKELTREELMIDYINDKMKILGFTRRELKREEILQLITDCFELHKKKKQKEYSKKTKNL